MKYKYKENLGRGTLFCFLPKYQCRWEMLILLWVNIQFVIPWWSMGYQGWKNGFESDEGEGGGMVKPRENIFASVSS